MEKQKMRDLLLEQYLNGNKGAITKKIASEFEVEENHFSNYLLNIDNLYKVVTKYCREKNNPRAIVEELDTLEQAVFDQWKKTLSYGEGEQDNPLRATEHDVSNLVGFCQRFMRNKNNIDNDKDFKAQLVWHVVTPETFRRSVEVDLGIRIAKAEVLDDKSRDFLKAQSALLKKIAGAKSAIKGGNNSIHELEQNLKRYGEGIKEFVDDQKKVIIKRIQDANKRLKESEEAYAKLMDTLKEEA